jgi:hypothetical protein
MTADNRTTPTSMPRRRGKHAHWAWWADAMAISAAGLIGGVLSLAHGEPLASTLALLSLAVVSGSYAIRSRREFKRGWRQGYETAVRVMLERAAGRTTDVQVRATVQGDPTPEPWDEHVPLRSPDGAGR